MTISYTNMLNTGGTANMRQSGANIAQYAAQMSSGNRITSASVDTASMSISTGLSSDAMTYHTYNQGLAEATSMIQVEDGGLQQVQSILDMLLAISTQATSGGLTSAERGFMNLEFQQLLQEMDRIANTTNFNGVYLLNGGQIETSTVTTPAPPANLPPQLNLPIPDQTATENIPYNYTIPTGTFTDPDNDFLTYMATLSGGAPLPGWLSFNAGTQTFSGTPPAGSAGTYDIEVTASDP
ncbi:MAG: putative Ig domain-containing protein, partial [Rickettsiales bacterium]